MSTNGMNIPTGLVLVPAQMQSGGTGFVPAQMQDGGSGSVPSSSPVTRLLAFKRGSPQALGTVQIMVGVLLFLFGVMLCVLGNPTGTVFTGVFAWAPLIYIIAGSLTVAADRSMSRCMIKGAMGMNIVSAVMAVFAMYMYFSDMVMAYAYSEEPNYVNLYRGILGVQLGFNLLVFCVSISASAFGCKATCCENDTPTLQYVVVGNHLPQAGTVMTVATPSPHALPSYNEVGHTLSDGGSSQDRGK